MGFWGFIGIFYGICTITSICILMYEFHNAVEVPQEIDIYDL